MTPFSSPLKTGESARIAITGVSGDVGMGAIRGVRQGEFPCWILGFDYGCDCAGFHLCDAHAQVKGVQDPGYIRQLEELLLQHRIQLLLCGVDSEVLLLAQWRSYLEDKTGCRIIVGDHDSVHCFSDKLTCADWLEQHGLNPPQTWEFPLPSRIHDYQTLLPLVAKPRHGNASQGIHLLQSMDDLQRLAQLNLHDYCLQEYIDGPEYTCGLLFDSDGMLRDWIATRRELANGRTMFAEVAQLGAIDALIVSIASLLRFPGALNLQLRLDPHGRARVFEINPRLSGSTSLRVAIGFNDPARMVAHWLYGKPITRADVRPARIYRYLTELVVSDSGKELHHD